MKDYKNKNNVCEKCGGEIKLANLVSAIKYNKYVIPQENWIGYDCPHCGEKIREEK